MHNFASLHDRSARAFAVDGRCRAATPRRWTFAILLIVLGLLACLQAGPGLAQSGKPAPADDASPRVRLLLDLLADEEVRVWLEKQRSAEKRKPVETPTAEPGIGESITRHIAELRRRFVELVQTAPNVPQEFSTALQRASGQLGGHVLWPLLALVVFLLIGITAERLYRRRSAVVRQTEASPQSVRQRLQAVGSRCLSSAIGLAIFAAASAGLFSLFEWPPVLRTIVLNYLMVAIGFRLGWLLLDLLLSPTAPALRILPTSDAAAFYWRKRTMILFVWFGLGFATLQIALGIGVSSPAVRVVGLTLALGLLAIGLEAIWRRPPGTAASDQDAAQARSRFLRFGWSMTGFFVVLWVLRFVGEFPLFWLILVAVGVPAAIAATRRALGHLLRPANGDTETVPLPSLKLVILERGLRAMWIVAAVLILANAWGIDLGAVTTGDTVATRLVRGALSAVLIVMIADFAWQSIRAYIDDRIAAVREAGLPDTEDARRRARIRTLLPIIKNFLFVLFLVMAVLMALASLGIDIGPLIAGAGVVGVALGFGAQTLVRDVISGVFYLLDDAFRVGEYIQSGNYKGTVESFSLRSVKLRHQRGPLFTVPFGVLGAVQNMSRDWVIDKFTLSVTYDSNIETAKKLIKKVGAELAEIPEFKPQILETLKMQGIERFGDSGIEVRLKMKTRPGEQFVIRRRAFALIKKAFDDNGIKFAVPTVQVAGGDPTAAAAQSVMAAAPPAAAQS